MIEFLIEYGLFLAKFGTLAILIMVVVGFIAGLAKRDKHDDGLIVEHLNKKLESLGDVVRQSVLGKEQLKQAAKERKKESKEFAKKGSQRHRVYVIDFKGDIRATATSSLRKEISAILSVAEKDDQVLVRLENSGGTVHEHGLAASQLLRIKDKGIPLTVSVDKVAASGGYLMACIANHIIAAPFAIIGSIGVIAQLPNFHRLLEKKGVDFEQVTAGRYKRTLTMFGKNTDEDRDKLQEEIEDVHTLFKEQITSHRPKIDLNRIATGEHWYGIRALELGLIDEIRTSDDFLNDVASDADLYRITYKRKKTLPERLLGGAETLLNR
ncbi:MAG: protease SohB [Rhodospirillaceae bacterium]|nr:protease SohB [Rhodospirillaceae bacterium]|tara:strand:+ start:6534 stop:7508 length:975 start_codon:yes stop_codon:yes gene_type:complete